MIVSQLHLKYRSQLIPFIQTFVLFLQIPCLFDLYVHVCSTNLCYCQVVLCRIQRGLIRLYSRNWKLEVPLGHLLWKYSWFEEKVPILMKIWKSLIKIWKSGTKSGSPGLPGLLSEIKPGSDTLLVDRIFISPYL